MPSVITQSTRSVTRKPNKLPTDDPKRRGNGGLTPRVRKAIEAQVFEGLRRKEAAEAAGLSEHTLYQALRKPSVLAHWNECLQVLRTGERARNIQRLVEIRDQNENKTASVQAVKVLEDAVEQRQSTAGARVTTPGIMIVVNAGRGAAPQITDLGVIEVNPLTGNEDQAVDVNPDDEASS